jgi:protein-tyrosine phosphatase
MDVDEILPQLLVGTCPRTRDHVEQLRDDFHVTAVLNLQTEEDFVYWEIDWPDLANHYDALGIEVRRVPVRDFDSDSLRDNLPQCVDQLDDLLRRGHTVYVHCNAGVNRSPSTVIAYLCWRQKWELEEAFQWVTRRRSCDPYLEAIVQAGQDRRE